MEPVKVEKPESTRKARRRIAALVIAAVAVSTAIYLVTESDTSPTVNITSITVYVGYASASDSYFGNPVFNVTANYETYHADSTVVFSIPFHNSGPGTHEITAIYTKETGFVVQSENPALPVEVSPGGTVHIAVHIQTPDHNFAGNLKIYSVVK